ncbi:MAG: 4-(cytidine 5'-diphospho)-2-C-methyl-D-erythritol kinase [Candidatus Omnitrophica bacterium]|nr:4-(cytidine 5'-diphospho)-2-C-methyl-D-erythritol kinase [Candidatus Omnitrophota bacterium]MCM8770491.1 4-(cytidine 5'-diphospho)-2-C-methyl-D-erythritol kinase [Candidatus Omnitrophota bacterium]
MKRLILYSPAKVNLYLKILDKRADGFHNLITLFERIDLCDKITLTRRKDKQIKIICNHPLVPSGDSNLAFKAAELLKKDFPNKTGINIRIKKNIPPASGLGGGSSNAATVLLGLNRFWRLGLSKKKLLTYAKKLGCDVAFFIYELPFALGRQKGDRIIPLDIRNKFWHILVVPHKTISTKSAYDLWEKNKIQNLTQEKKDVKIQVLALKQNSLSLLGKTLFNSFEKISGKICPDILEIREKLKDLGITAISVSGKGPAVFGIVTARKEAIRCKRQLKNKSRSVFVVRTL